MFDTLKTKWRLYRINKRYNKLLEDAGKRYLNQKEEALAYRLEEADRKTEATLSYFHNVFKENN
jgi:hypothetical protein